MAKLAFVLQDGFKNDRVTITLAGRQVYHAEGVSTLLLRGYAAQFLLEVPPGRKPLRVAVPSRRLVADFQVDVSADTTLILSLQEDRIILQTHAGPVGYI